MRAHVYTRTATVATLVGWQVNKVNSPVFPFPILIVDKMMRIYYTAQLITNRTANIAQQGTNRFEAADRSGNRLARGGNQTTVDL